MTDLATRPPALDLAAPPVTREVAAEILGEPPIGFWAITEGPDPRTNPCRLGCLAPGSSPHAHATIVGWWLVSATTRVRLDLDLMCQQAASIHAWPE